MGLGIFFLVGGAVIIFKLADADNRNAWSWAGGMVALSLLIGQVIQSGGAAVWLAFVITFATLWLSNDKKPDQRR